MVVAANEREWRSDEVENMLGKRRIIRPVGQEGAEDPHIIVMSADPEQLSVVIEMKLVQQNLRELLPVLNGMMPAPVLNNPELLVASPKSKANPDAQTELEKHYELTRASDNNFDEKLTACETQQHHGCLQISSDKGDIRFFAGTKISMNAVLWLDENLPNTTAFIVQSLHPEGSNASLIRASRELIQQLFEEAAATLARQYPDVK